LRCQFDFAFYVKPTHIDQIFEVEFAEQLNFPFEGVEFEIGKVIDFGCEELIALAAEVDIGLSSISEESVNSQVFDIRVFSVLHNLKFI
jgi:hypothetical protein